VNVEFSPASAAWATAADLRAPAPATPPIPGFVMPEFEDIEIEIQDADIEIVEQTLVRERPAH
jgi:hypothetical protein